MPTEQALAKALAENRVLRTAKDVAREKKIARALSNLDDGTCESITDAARGVGLPVSTVTEALRNRKGKVTT